MNGHRAFSVQSSRPRLREVVEELTFTEQVLNITSDIKRFDEILEAITWALAKSPDDFPLADEVNGLHIVKTDSWGAIPRLRVFFKFDDNQTRLCWVEPIPSDAEEDGLVD